MAHYPPIEEILSKTDTPKLLEVHRSVLSILSGFFWFFGASFLTIILLAVFGDVAILPNIPVLKVVSLRWLLVVPSIQLLEILRTYHDNLYIFYKDKMTHLGGRLSLQYFVPEIKYADIRAIKIHQDIMGRIFNYGTIEVNTAATSESEILIEGVRAPFELAKIMDMIRAVELKKFESIAPG